MATTSMREFCEMATKSKPPQDAEHGRKPYTEPSLKGVPVPSALRTHTEPTLAPSTGGLTSTPSLATMVVPDSPVGQDEVWRPHLSGLRNDMAATHLDIQNDFTKLDHTQLVDRIVVLEADFRAMQKEAEHWRLRCLESESARASAAAAEGRAHLELHGAHERERKLAQQSVELRLHKAEMEHSAATSEFEVRKHLSELRRCEEMLKLKDQELKLVKEELLRGRVSSQAQDSLLKAREAEVEAVQAEVHRLHETKRRQQECIDAMEAELKGLRGELREALEYGESRRGALDRLERDHAELLERERSGRLLALSASKEHADALEARLREFEAKHSDAVREAECYRTRSDHLDEVNRKLRMDLQESINQGVRSGRAPFYHDGPARAVAGTEDRVLDAPRPPELDASAPRPPSQAPFSPRRAPRSPGTSRLDYPRSTCSRRLRSEVLTARTGGSRYDEASLPLTTGSYSYGG